MFGHKSRQFAEFERRQNTQVYPRWGLFIDGYRPGPSLMLTAARNVWGYTLIETTTPIDTKTPDASRFRGYAYKGVAGKV